MASRTHAANPTRGGGARSWGPLGRLMGTLLLVVAFAVGLAAGLRAVFPGFSRLEPGSERIPKGVFVEIAGQRVELGSLSRFEAVGVLEELAGPLTVLPQDAHIDRLTTGVVPEVNGRRLDVAATVAAALAAPPGQSVPPAFCPTPAVVGLRDFPGRAIYNGNPAKNEVAIILNVAWGDEYLDDIAGVVEKAGGKLTVCPVGTWLEEDGGRAAWLAAAVERGHEVGNHGYYNRPMTYGQDQVRQELDETTALIEKACGRRPAIFAPPMGEFDAGTLAAAAEAGYLTVKWSLDTIDWRREGIDVIANRVISRVKAGDIILCHPTEMTGPAMEKFLPAITAKGLRVVTLSELLSPDLPPETPLGAQAPSPGTDEPSSGPDGPLPGRG